MKRIFIGRSIWSRHGWTKYTYVFPDLLPKGIIESINLGRLYSVYLKENNWNPILISSPKDRALGTMSFAMQQIGLDYQKDKGLIITDEAFRSFDIQNHDRIDQLVDQVIGHIDESEIEKRFKVWDKYYYLSREFEENAGDNWELRSQVKKRFGAVVGKVLQQLILSKGKGCVLKITHAELLGQWLNQWFGLLQLDAPLLPTEPAIFDFYQIRNNLFEIEIEFRGMKKIVIFNNLDMTFVNTDA